MNNLTDSRAPSDREVLTELVGLHAVVLTRMPFVQLLVVIGLGFLVYPSVPAVLFFGWACLTLSAEGVRALYAIHIRRSGAAIDPTVVHRRLVYLAAASGAAVAAGAASFLPHLSIENQAFLSLTVCIMPAAGVAVANSSQRILGAYAVSMLVPTACVWAWVHPSQALTACSLIVVYCAFLIVVSADGEQLLRRSIIIRNERDQVVKELERTNAEVRDAVIKAEQSAQARARVLASASHDLRQPLHALSIYSAILTANPAPETLKEVGQNIDQIIRSLGNLLTGLLDLSRLSAGHYIAETQPFAFDRIINGVCDEFAPTAAAKGLELVRKIDSVTLDGDALAVGRICRNLIDNAIKYTEQGTVTVSTGVETSDAGTFAVLRVADTGKGVPLSEQSRIFEEFYQLDNPGRDRSRGVGLGLAIVQRLAELIHATISVASEPPGGTEFSVRFAGVVNPTARWQQVAATPTQDSLSGKRIYVVDDERDILKSMNTLLGIWGATSMTAQTPADAERLLKQEGNPDLMIVDLRLGRDEHGAQLANRLQREFGRFPVLIITGETSSEALREANEQSYVVLQKPIAPEVLRNAIGTALERPAA